MDWKNVLIVAVVVLMLACLCSLVFGATLLLRRSWFAADQQVELPAQELVEEPMADPVIVVVTVQAQQAEAISALATQVAQLVVEPTLEPEEQPEQTGVLTETLETAVVTSTVLSTGDLFQTPVKATDVFNDESAWLIAEPGVILDNTAAWTIPSTEAKHFANVPEGGFWYASLGEGVITVDGSLLVLVAGKGFNYLVLIRGRIDDTIVDSDLNETVEITNFVPGHAIWNHMPTGAYVSKGWFRQQLVASTTSGFTNCGATGCSRVHVVLFDVDSHFTQVFEVQAGALDDWKLLED